MRFTVTLILLYLCLSTAYSQALTGKIYDSKTLQPIPQVSVYLNGTSLNTMTDVMGEFRIPSDIKLNTDLIISHIGYNLISVPNPFDELPDKIYLTQRENMLQDIIIDGENSDNIYSWDEKLTAFRKELFGKTDAGRSCIIKNEEDIKLYFDSEEKKLVASSDVPLIIHNQYLGYEIQMILFDFYAEYPLGMKLFNVTREANRTLFVGVSTFTDLAPKDKKIRKRRRELYDKSYVSFFKNLADNNLKESGFVIRNGKKAIDADQYFRITDTLSMKKIEIIPDMINNKEEIDGEQVFGTINIIKDKKEKSTLKLLTNSFIVDPFGNTDTVNKLLFSGVMGNQRFGYMLPLDYTPHTSIPTY